LDELYRIGVITEPHGIHGEVKIFPTTDDPDRIKKLKEVILDTGKEHLTLHPVSLKWVKQFVVVKFKEYDSINEIEQFCKKELFVTRENTVKLSEDEYLIPDLIGMKVVDEECQMIGILEDVLDTGANDIYQIRRDDKTMLLLPAIKQCILDVNVEEQIMKVHVMEGL